MLLIGTIDGTLTAFNEDSLDLGRPVWTLDTSPGALLSSSLSKIEVGRVTWSQLGSAVLELGRGPSLV
jgi:hypothetical protein